MALTSDRIVESLENKSILITGSTGFVGKMFVEKVLRIQPNVKQLFLLVRASDTLSAKQRLEREVIQMDIFKVLREKYGGNFGLFFWNKVTPVVGDIGLEGFGVKDDKLTNFLWSEIDVIINSAATTRFNERYDVALDINTQGAKHVLTFAMRCVKLEIFVHVSTAYVAKDNMTTVLEKELTTKEGSKKYPCLNIEEELKLAQEKLKELIRNEASMDTIKTAMKELGTRRANKFGWPSTYTFTKAMGEMLLGELRGNLPLVILRPTIITSTYKEPFPGWIEGIRAVDVILIGYATGKIKCLPVNLTTILDMVPGDMVVNAMLAIMVNHSRQPSMSIYHVGSSMRNPVRFKTIYDINKKYFTMNPYIGRDGKTIKVGKVFFFPTLGCFNIYMTMRHKPLLLVLWQLGALFSHNLQDRYVQLNRKYNHLMAVAKAFRPFMFGQRRFDDQNLQKLRLLIEEKDEEAFGFDTNCINWDHYLAGVHIPGIIKYGMQQNKSS